MSDLGLSRLEETVQLRVSSPEECRALGERLGERLQASAAKCFGGASGYGLECVPGEDGGIAGRVSRLNFAGEFSTSFGQNLRRAADGQMERFYSLTFSAEATVPSVARAEKTAEQIEGWAAGLGVAGGGGLLALLLWLMALFTGYIVISAWMVIGALVAGGATGAWVGTLFGGLLRHWKVSRAASDPEVTQAAGDWTAFTAEARAILAEIDAGQ